MIPSLLDLLSNAMKLWDAASADVQAALVGNVGIVLVALISLGATAWFTARQLRHEREEKTKDRAIDVKKEVLLEGVRGASQAVSILSSMPHLDRDIKEIALAFNAGMAKLTVSNAVADLSAVRQSAKLSAQLRPAYLRCAVARKPLDDMKENLVKLDSLMAYQIGESKRIVAMQVDHGSHGDADKRFSALDELFNAIHQDYLQSVEDRAKLSSEIAKKQLHLARLALQEQLTITPVLLAYISCVRMDMGVQGDVAEFLSAAAIDPENAMDNFERLIAVQSKDKPEASATPDSNASSRANG